jgi:hypothetical protein
LRGRDPDGAPLLVFWTVRAARAAAAFSLAGWLYLALAGPEVALPFGQRAVPSVLIWPAAAAFSTMAVSRSQLTRWEVRAPRPLWPYRLVAVCGSAIANLAAALALAPPYGRSPLVTWFVILQAVALACSVGFGDKAALPLAAVILVAMFDLAQDGSLLLRAVTGSTTTSLVVASGAFALLAGIASSDRGQRRGGD